MMQSVNYIDMETFSRGDEVSLTIDGIEVAVGTVQKVHPEETVRNTHLGRNRIGVLIERCCDSSRELPFPLPNVCNLSDAIDSCVIWNTYDAHFTSLPPRMSMGNRPVEEDTFVASCSKSEMDVKQSAVEEGDNVDMFISGSFVAKGLVSNTNPTSCCHNVELGFGRISVQILEAVKKEAKLPYPHPGAETIKEAIHTWVMWDVGDVFRRLGTDSPEIGSASIFTDF